jgi:hypothetical protein
MRTFRVKDDNISIGPLLAGRTNCFLVVTRVNSTEDVFTLVTFFKRMRHTSRLEDVDTLPPILLLIQNTVPLVCCIFYKPLMISAYFRKIKAEFEEPCYACNSDMGFSRRPDHPFSEDFYLDEPWSASPSQLLFPGSLLPNKT